MRVLQVTTSLSQGGLARVLLDLSAELKRRGCRVSLCCTHFPGVHFAESEGLWDSVHHFSASSQLSKLRSLREVLRQGEFDVVHAHQEPVAMIAARLFSRARALETVHLLENWRELGPPPLPLLRAWSADRHVACSREMWERMSAERLAPKRKLAYVDNGIPWPAPPDPERVSALRAAWGVPTGAPVVGTVARLAPQKGVAHLLEAFREALAAVPEARLVIAGDGELRAELEAQAGALGVGERVRFLGYVENPGAVLDALDLFALPSLFEGLSIALLEAMARGLPVVATALPSTARVIGGEGAGRLVPPEDPRALAEAITGLLRDRDAAKQMGAAARERVCAGFTVERMAEQYLDLYGELCGGKGRAA